jgi:hypothetical protein
MILLWGLGSDPPLALVRRELAALGRTAVLVDQRAVLETSVEVVFDGVPAGWVELGGVRIDLGRVDAAYLRPHDPRAVPAVAAAGRDGAAGRHALESYEALRLWSELTCARVVNRISVQASNSSKPYQLEVIRAAGFEVPETLITTDPDEAAGFCAAGDTIYKSVSGVRSVVARMGVDARARLDRVAACPTQFQRRVPGLDVRVHVVGDEVHACELSSSADDYRYAGDAVARRQVEIDAGVADRCRALAAALELPVAGIDLRRTPEGAWHCFEVNPSPGFPYFDDGRIARSLAGFLAAGRA